MIPPTIGRIVLLRLRGSDPESQPLAAQIARVNEDGSINVGYLDTAGVHRNATNVILHQDGEPCPDTAETTFCEWMPYQIGQSKQQTQPAGDFFHEDARVVAIEKEAKRIYDGWRGEHPGEWKPWITGGNSDKQNEAREAARDFFRDRASDDNREAAVDASKESGEEEDGDNIDTALEGEVENTTLPI